MGPVESMVRGVLSAWLKIRGLVVRWLMRSVGRGAGIFSVVLTTIEEGESWLKCIQKDSQQCEKQVFGRIMTKIASQLKTSSTPMILISY
jgi:hypothetical protein